MDSCNFSLDLYSYLFLMDSDDKLQLLPVVEEGINYIFYEDHYLIINLKYIQNLLHFAIYCRHLFHRI